MRELRRAPLLASLGMTLVLVASAGSVMAQPQAAHLVVQGPLDLDGPSSLRVNGAALALRGSGTPDFDQLRFTFHAANVLATFTTIEEQCVATPSLGFVALPALTDRPQRLAVDEVLGLVPDVPAPVPRVADPALRSGLSLARSAAGTLNGVLDAGVDSLTRTSASPLPDAPCLYWGPGSHRKAIELTDAVLEVTPSDGDYTIFWDGRAAEDEPRGAATLDAGSASARLLTESEFIQVRNEQTPSSWTAAPTQRIESGWVRTESAEGSGAVLGTGSVLLFRAHATLRGLNAEGEAVERVFETGESRDSSLPGPTGHTIKFLEVAAEGVAGHYRSPAGVRLYGEQVQADLDGALAIPDARGTLSSEAGTHDIEGGRLVLEGALQFTLRAAEAAKQSGTPGAPEAPQTPGDQSADGAMLLDMGGDITAASAGPAPQQDEFPTAMATTAAAVSVFAALAGALAYFWPTLKFLVAPLYTRIAPDAVLAHGARENIYRLIKDEPGIHAHEVASRLSLGWGTTVYHLKLLEKNSLVVSRHEGRYKRFFVTGDQRLQHQGAVALLRNPTSRSIAGVVAAQPGLIQKQVCEALGLSPSLASWHLQRLEAAGVVRAERVGRSVRYAPGLAWHELQLLDAPRAPPAAVGPAPAGPVA